MGLGAVNLNPRQRSQIVEKFSINNKVMSCRGGHSMNKTPSKYCHKHSNELLKRIYSAMCFGLGFGCFPL